MIDIVHLSPIYFKIPDQQEQCDEARGKGGWWGLGGGEPRMGRGEWGHVCVVVSTIKIQNIYLAFTFIFIKVFLYQKQ